MTWIRRQADGKSAHLCDPPRGEMIGDLWLCDDCGQLYRLGPACEVCDSYGEHPHEGLHMTGTAWRHATGWQRWRHRKQIRRCLTPMRQDPPRTHPPSPPPAKSEAPPPRDPRSRS